MAVIPKPFNCPACGGFTDWHEPACVYCPCCDARWFIALTRVECGKTQMPKLTECPDCHTLALPEFKANVEAVCCQKCGVVVEKDGRKSGRFVSGQYYPTSCGGETGDTRQEQVHDTPSEPEKSELLTEMKMFGGRLAQLEDAVLQITKVIGEMQK